MNWVDGSEKRTVEVVGFEAHKTTSQYRPSLKHCSTQLFQRSCSQKKQLNSWIGSHSRPAPTKHMIGGMSCMSYKLWELSKDCGPILAHYCIADCVS